MLGYGFGIGFGITQIIMPLMFLLVFGTVIVAFVRGIGQWNKNNHSPRLTVPAAVVSRRTLVTHHHHHGANGAHHVHPVTSYYVTFEVENGDRMEFSVSGSEYGYLAEGDRGQLRFQGTRYLGFQRQDTEEPF